MPGEFLNDITGSALAKALDGTMARHRALANNIANADTPGFRRSDVSFHAELQAALSSITKAGGSLSQLEQIEPHTATDGNAIAGFDGNTVSIETEMGELARNTLEYETDVQLLNAKHKMLRSVITDGRR